MDAELHPVERKATEVSRQIVTYVQDNVAAIENGLDVIDIETEVSDLGDGKFLVGVAVVYGESGISKQDPDVPDGSPES